MKQTVLSFVVSALIAGLIGPPAARADDGSDHGGCSPALSDAAIYEKLKNESGGILRKKETKTHFNFLVFLDLKGLKIENIDPPNHLQLFCTVFNNDGIKIGRNDLYYDFRFINEQVVGVIIPVCIERKYDARNARSWGCSMAFRHANDPATGTLSPFSLNFAQPLAAPGTEFVDNLSGPIDPDGNAKNP